MASAWLAYWFRPAPLLDLAAVRIAVVGFHLAFLAWWYPPGMEFPALAVLPADIYAPVGPLRVLESVAGMVWRPSLEVMLACYWVTLIAAFFAFVGSFTRSALCVTAGGSLLLHSYAWSYGELHHPEALIALTLVALALSPCGGALSVDDLRRRLRDGVAAGRYTAFRHRDAESPYARWPRLLVQWLFVLIYFSAGYEKLRIGGFEWLNGHTLRYYLVEDGLRWGGAGVAVAALPLPIMQSLSAITLWLELTFVLAVLVPALRVIYLPLGVALHSGIYLTMRAPFFQYIALYSVLIPWSRLAARRRETTAEQTVEVFYDGPCPLCIRAVTVLRYFDWRQRLVMRDLEKHWRPLSRAHPEVTLDDCRREMHVVLPDGSLHAGFIGFREVLKRVPLGWPLLPLFYLPFASRLGPRIYRRVADNRRRAAPVCDHGRCAVGR